MKPIFIVDVNDALGFGLAGMSCVGQAPPPVPSPTGTDAVYIVSASKSDVLAQLPAGAPVVVLPCRDTAARNR